MAAPHPREDICTEMMNASLGLKSSGGFLSFWTGIFNRSRKDQGIVMSNDHQLAEDLGKLIGQTLPLWPLWFLLGSSGLKEANLAWFMAVLIVLGVECGLMVADWINPKRTASESPNGWFDRLAGAVARAGVVIYCGVALLWTHSRDFVWLTTALAHFDFSSSAVWAPCLLWGILSANAAYAIPMGLRYRVGPHQRADRISTALSAVLWMAGAAALLGFHAFAPQPFVGERVALAVMNYLFASLLLWPDDPAATHFVVTWLYLSVILRQATKLAVLLRGDGGAARDRAHEQEEQERQRRRWPTAHDGGGNG